MAVKDHACDIQPLAVLLKQICGFFSFFYLVFITSFVALLFLVMMSSRIPMALSDVVSIHFCFFQNSVIEKEKENDKSSLSPSPC